MDTNIQIEENRNYLKELEQQTDKKQFDNKIQNNQIVILPQKYLDKYYYAYEAVNFTKYLLSNNVKVDLFDEGEIQTRALHSFDIWLPIIYIVEMVVFPIVTGLITSYIYDKLKGREHEKAKVNVEIIVKNGEKEKIIRYNGDATNFKETIDKINLND